MGLWQALEEQIDQGHPLYFWLACQHSLTEELSNHLSQQVQVKVLKEYKCKLARSESNLLASDNKKQTQLGYARDILLYSDNEPYIGARTIMSESTWNACHLERLGNTPIGTLLFDNPKNSKRNIEVKSYLSLDFSDWADFKAVQKSANNEIWIRRSVFDLNDHPILIHELFSDRLVRQNG